MSEDIYAKPDLSKKVRFQSSEEDNGTTGIYQDTDNAAVYDNCWAEKSEEPELKDTADDQQQTTAVDVPKRKSDHVRPAAVFLVLLCLLLLVAVIVLVVLLIQDKNWNADLTSERDELRTSYDEIKNLNMNLTSERDELRTSYDEIKNLNMNLTSERDELRTSYAEIKNLSMNLTSERDELQTRYDEIQNLTAILTKERDELLTSHNEKICCPSTSPCWRENGGSSYFISSTRKNWEESNNLCLLMCATLVIVNSRAENDFLRSLQRTFWIGLTDRETENNFKWVDGSTLTSPTFWGRNQPDNHGTNGDENCVTFSNGHSNWNDLRCDDDLIFVCEKNNSR